jgi:sugar/nucleoside kinase (ribokinase family)
MTQRLLVVGDANLDLVLRGDVVPRFGQAEQVVDDSDLVLGGSAAIVACGLARLEVPVGLVAAVGDDAFGALTRDALATADVNVSAVRVVSEAATGISVILSTPRDRAILTRLGAIPSLRGEDIETALVEQQPDWVHFASPFLVAPLLPELGAIARRLRAAGVGTSLDTNWDPAERWEQAADLIMSVDVLLPNRAELAAIARVVDPAAADHASAVAARGPSVVVKDGPAGGFSVAPDGSRTSAPGIPVDVVDTTGAGDSFDAGYLAAIAHGISDERERLRWATTAGSLSTQGTGGTAAQAGLDELRA